MTTAPTLVEAIQYALEEADHPTAPGTVFICHGKPWCYDPPGDNATECPWCHAVRPGDPRTPEEIEAEMLEAETWQ